ncbi:methylated-DNA--[protein]-cysteine S-methyltransferase [Ectobacillus antri]|jgi:methylated-DNA-[protein]-cysteine S-methyltransferase|uniref:Methylated-DNA--protein-cysteine methyltransferase n=1 Tax=Ectobacillus antri TaxID=2486280 RepID=A0ABT6H445_9BACI|nr:methylated-DNA--[protein]-cysteine S-methyltransferase [Ectobacillus antri]MDG4656931.1 methylated-DNA--[protein]-cysteine S-methyltransferase [Ectobacillus antri]MDG5754033.1 methylated-DNA--[protein]-cysteine S-methyltransferase [Ectobacillus antri]
MKHNVYWTHFTHPKMNGTLYIAATDKGICRITWPHETFEVLEAWVQKKIPDASLIENPVALAPYSTELTEYFNGTRTTFTVPYDLYGTTFQTAVWKALATIPFGETRSYSDIAAETGNANAVRAVGTANGANPVPIIVPCHRVIGKNNALTGFRGGLQMKEVLLTLEGYHNYRKQGHERFQF